MATLMLEHGAEIRHIQEMLGHAELTTTQIYTQVSIRRLQAVHAATHPAEKAKPGLRKATSDERSLRPSTDEERNSERQEAAGVTETLHRHLAADTRAELSDEEPAKERQGGD